ncbi:insulinase family protein [Betaproteobacteria bacterium]|nr:insulinase family protein [Betaproteobacteria bacterium]
MKKSRIRFYFFRSLIFCILCPVFSLQSLEKEQAQFDQRLNIKSWKTNSGSSVFFVNSQRLPMVDIMIDVDAGSRWDPSGLEGLASLVAGMLLKGHYLDGKTVSEEEVGEFFVQNSIIRSVSTSRDKVSISLRFLNEPEVIQKLGRFLHNVLSKPAFNESILARQKSRSLLALREALTRPQQLALRNLWDKMYPDHPYGRSVTEQSLGNVSREELQIFFRKFWTPERITFSVVGDLEDKELESFLGDMTSFQSKNISAKFGENLERQENYNYKKILPPVVFPLAETIMIDHPAEQSHIWIGTPMLARHQIEDIFPFFVANYILGGSGFGSRLTTEVREKRGLSYSVFSGFSLLKQKGPFFIGLQTSKQNTSVALKVVQETLTDFVHNGPDDIELEKAKTGLIGGFALKLDSNRKALMNLSQIAYYDLPLDYLDNWIDRIASVTKEDVKRVLKTYFVPENMQTVIVGK